MATRGGAGRGGRQARQVHFLIFFFFLLSSFLLLTFIISFVANCSNIRGEAKWNGTGRDNTGGDSNTGWDGGQADGRRRWEKVGRRAGGEHWDS